jgi:hypothetical protein
MTDNDRTPMPETQPEANPTREKEQKAGIRELNDLPAQAETSPIRPRQKTL